MRSVFIFALLFGAALAKPNLSRQEDETSKEFEEQNMQMFNSKEDEKAAGAELKKEEAEIKKENEAFATGDSNFEEALYPWSDIPEAEMAIEKDGGIEKSDGKVGSRRMQISRATGLIETPEHMRVITDKAQARLDEIYSQFDKVDMPASYDARDHGLVTPAKNQKSCGSCAAFAATATHETCLLRAKTPSDNLDLSEQQVMDCAFAEKRQGANRCNGAYIGVYQEYMAETAKGTFSHETQYPYQNTAPNDACLPKGKWSAGNKITAAVVDYGCDETKLMKMVLSHGAVATGLDAGGAFGNYKSGVYDTCANPPGINHAITVIGWGTENNTPYWLIKNSWGANWGLGGYIKVKRGTCGIGGNCATTDCGTSGEAYVLPPPPPPAPVIPPSQICDIANTYGAGITGAVYRLTYRYGSGDSDVCISEVKCTDSKCQANIPGPSNACMYICNKLAC